MGLQLQMLPTLAKATAKWPIPLPILAVTIPGQNFDYQYWMLWWLGCAVILLKNKQTLRDMGENQRQLSLLSSFWGKFLFHIEYENQTELTAETGKPSYTLAIHGFECVQHLPSPILQTESHFYTGSIETETLIPCPQPSINPKPAESQGTSPQYCVKYQPAAPTEIQHGLDELLKANSSP